MLELEKRLHDVYSKLEKVQEKMVRLEDECSELKSVLEEKTSLIATLKQNNLDLEKKIIEGGENQLNGGDISSDLREELKRYVKVIDECLDHLKKL